MNNPRENKRDVCNGLAEIIQLISEMAQDENVEIRISGLSDETVNKDTETEHSVPNNFDCEECTCEPEYYELCDSNPCYKNETADPWECALKILESPDGMLQALFGTSNRAGILRNYSADECMAKISKYEKACRDVEDSIRQHPFNGTKRCLIGDNVMCHRWHPPLKCTIKNIRKRKDGGPDVYILSDDIGRHIISIKSFLSPANA